MEIFHRAGTALVKGRNSIGKEENNDGNDPLRCGAPFFLAAMYLREFRHATLRQLSGDSVPKAHLELKNSPNPEEF